MTDRKRLLQIVEPCPATWDEMSGTAERRHCDHCDKSVHNLSEIETAAVAELLDSGKPTCVRVRHDSKGVVAGHPRLQLLLTPAVLVALAACNTVENDPYVVEGSALRSSVAPLTLPAGHAPAFERTVVLEPTEVAVMGFMLEMPELATSDVPPTKATRGARTKERKKPSGAEKPVVAPSAARLELTVSGAPGLLSGAPTRLVTPVVGARASRQLGSATRRVLSPRVLSAKASADESKAAFGLTLAFEADDEADAGADVGDHAAADAGADELDAGLDEDSLPGDEQ